MTQSDDRFSYSCFYAPGFDLEREYEDFKRRINSQGGAVDPMHLYLDYENSARWCELASQDNYYVANSVGADHLNWMADEILFRLKKSDCAQDTLNIISLGSGDGRKETDLAGMLLTKKDIGIQLYYLDCSHFLLRIAHKYATKMLGKKKNVSFHMVEGNFEHLHDLMPLFTERAPKGQKIFQVGCLLGYSFSNLKNELHFVQDSLSAFQKGDLLIMDVNLTYAPSTNHEEIQKKDPRFAPAYGYTNTFEHWLLTPFEQHHKKAKNILIESVLDTHTSPVPGSYSITVQARVDGQAVIKMVHIRRYDQEQLSRTMFSLGWKTLGGKIFGPDQHRFVGIYERI